ncbi:hypothetical protein NIES2101_25705 [Calothrix sp. HK-06]|nr:hypothetical protein NIES2101_25705 [Calothrix sp. HK-06]
MKTITEVEYQELLEESIAAGEVIYNYKGFDYIIKFQNQIEKNYFRYVELRHGLELEICEDKFYRDLSINSSHNDLQLFVSKFYLLGNHHVLTPGIKEIADDYMEQVGKNYLFYLPDIKEIEQWSAGKHVKVVRICVSPELLRDYCTDSESLPEDIQAVINNNSTLKFHRSGSITPAMFAILQQLMDSPYQGMIQRLYLESKVMELLALQLNQIVQSEKSITFVSKLKHTDIDKIYQARDILIRKQDSPPCLLDLAKMVGLGERKLRQGFKEIFNTTVFGYLHDYRMEQAWLLLCGSKMRVADVAQITGYSHLGYFGQAFKRKFGITPKECKFREKPLK